LDTPFEDEPETSRPAVEERVAPSAIPRPASRGPIATLEVVGGGVLRGQKFTITTVLAHVGRGEHNDVVIPEESVSDSHAKLQRRDSVWYVTDLGSTNGTYVAGRRIDAEVPLGQTAELRLGGVKLTFNAVGAEPITGPRDATREFSGAVAAEAAQRAGIPPRPAPAPDVSDSRVTAARPQRVGRDLSAPTVAPISTPRATGLWWLAVLLVVGGLVAMVYFMFIKSR
jgi:predicted component of type VI protein secretion system